jgi:hypothetical protein
MNIATFLKFIAIFLIASALSFHSPSLAFAFIVAVLVFHTLGRFFIFFVRAFIIGLFVGEGVKMSGVLKQFRAPRTRSRRARTCFPWEERGDDLPPEL